MNSLEELAGRAGDELRAMDVTAVDAAPVHQRLARRRRSQLAIGGGLLAAAAAVGSVALLSNDTNGSIGPAESPSTESSVNADSTPTSATTTNVDRTDPRVIVVPPGLDLSAFFRVDGTAIEQVGERTGPPIVVDGARIYRIVSAPEDGYVVGIERDDGSGNCKVVTSECQLQIATYSEGLITPIPELDGWRLFDNAVFSGTWKLLVGDLSGDSDEGDLSLYDMNLGALSKVGTARALDSFVARASFTFANLNATIVVSGTRDLGEFVSYLDPDGNEVDLSDPTVDDEYGRAPYVMQAVLSPDGATLAYLEGPDTNSGTGESEGSWVLVVTEARTGEEQHRVDLRSIPNQVLSPFLDFDGRFVLVSEVDDVDPMVVDLDADEPTATPLPGAPGAQLSFVDG